MQIPILAMEGVVLNVVFTGPASNKAGKALVRANLIAACHTTGRLAVQEDVKADTDLVVASRADTVKARAAAARGLKVVSYQAFLAEHLVNVAIPTDGAWSWFTDASSEPKRERAQPADGAVGLAEEYVL